MLDKQVDPNGIFFVPEVSRRTRFSDSISTDITELENELKSCQRKLDILATNKQNTVEIMSILNHFNTNHETIETKVKDEKIDSSMKIADAMHLSLLEYQENERNRIARDIHDSTVQNLTSLIHKVELCTKLIDKDLIRTKLEMQTMIITLRNTIDE